MTSSETVRDGPRSTVARHLGVPGRQRTAVLPGRRALPVQPSAQAPLPRGGRHPDHACGGIRDGLRRGARSTDGQDRGGRYPADLRSVTATSSTETPLDSLGMLEAVAALPEQVAGVLTESWGFGGLPEHDEVEHVVVIGMGGSGIAGEVLAAAAGPYMPVPVMVFKSYNV